MSLSYKRDNTMEHTKQRALLVAGCVRDLRVIETTLLRTGRQETQQAKMLIYGLGRGTKESVSGNKLEHL